MSNVIRLLISILLLAEVPVPAAEPTVDWQASPVVAMAPADLTVIGGSDHQLTVLEESLAAFERHGLELPALLVRFSEDDEACQGHAGYYHPHSILRSPVLADEVIVCVEQRSIVLHELAHAWERHFGTDEHRQAFLDLWGLERWRHPDDSWYDRGTERAAETVAFSLMLREPTDNPDMLRYVCGYEVLTGRPAPAPVVASCAD